MAAPPEIKVRITGDTKGLEDAGNKVAKTLKDVNASISRLEKEIADNIRISRGYAGAVEELNKELKNGTISQGQYQKALSRLRRDEKETEVATKELRRELSGLKQDSRNLQSAALGAASGQSALNSQIRGTTPTLLEFNRVIQDAPYGIQGVGNNIQQLVANFAVLKQNAGSTKAAFSALLGVFSGPAGLLFVVSAATSLLTVFAGKLFDSKENADALKKKLEEVNESFDVELGLNQQILDNLETQELSTSDIKKAREGILLNQLQSVGAVLAENQALLNQLKIQNEIVSDWELITQLITQGVGGALVILNQFYKVSQDINDAISGALKDVLGINSVRARFAAATAGDLKKQKALEQENLSIQTKLQEVVGQILELRKESTKETKKEQSLKTPKFSTVDLEGLEAIGLQAGQTLQKSLSEQQNAVRKGMGDLLDKPLADSLRKATPQLEAFAAKFDVVKEAGIAFSSAIGQGFSQLGSLISNSLQTGIGVLDIFVSTLVNGIAQLAASFAQKALIDRLFAVSSLGANLTASNANAITIATSAAAGLGPLGLAALPGFLSGTLATVNAAFAAIPKFAQGGIVGGGSFTGDDLLARLNSGERVLTIQDQGILTRVLQGNLRSMGEPAVVTVEGVIRGNDILIANRRAERNNRRFGR